MDDIKKYYNTIVLEGLRFKKLIKYEEQPANKDPFNRIGHWYLFMSLTNGEESAGYFDEKNKPKIVFMKERLTEDEYKELERFWDASYKEYDYDD